MDVGVVGLGKMGGLMVGGLLDAGHEVVVYDVSAAAVERAVGAGAKSAGSGAELGASSRVVLLSLPLPEHVAEVVAGKTGLLTRPAEGLILVDTSTMDPATTRQMAGQAAEAGVGYLDAPVLGRPEGFGNWCLPIGGDPEAMETARPVLEAIARTIIHVGASGSGHAIKLLNNLMFGAINAITVEAFAGAAAVGVSPQKFFDAVANSGAATVSPLFRQLAPKILEGDFSPTFTVDLLYKDNMLALRMLEEAQASIIVGNAVQTLNGLARAGGHGSADTSAVVKVYETLLGVKVAEEP